MNFFETNSGFNTMEVIGDSLRNISKKSDNMIQCLDAIAETLKNISEKMEKTECPKEEKKENEDDLYKKMKKEIEKFYAADLTRLHLAMQFYAQFEQLWPSTATAFDTDVYGAPLIGGAAMTSAVVTIFQDETGGTFFVFVDGQLCYSVTKKNNQAAFLQDVENRLICSRREARKKYC